jgi:Holliday junction resolvasome RuvABC DNA-binding subunit
MAEMPFMTEVLAALTALGFSATEARKALERLNAEQKISPNLEENIKAALRILRK